MVCQVRSARYNGEAGPSACLGLSGCQPPSESRVRVILRAVPASPTPAAVGNLRTTGPAGLYCWARWPNPMPDAPPAAIAHRYEASPDVTDLRITALLAGHKWSLEPEAVSGGLVWYHPVEGTLEDASTCSPALAVSRQRSGQWPRSPASGLVIAVADPRRRQLRIPRRGHPTTWHVADNHRKAVQRGGLNAPLERRGAAQCVSATRAAPLPFSMRR
jgi:hypothetical protein